MADVLIFGDDRSSALRHQIPLAMPDPIGYIESGESRQIVGGSLDVPRLEALGSWVGDVITIERALNRPGFGGCRIDSPYEFVV